MDQLRNIDMLPNCLASYSVVNETTRTDGGCPQGNMDDMESHMSNLRINGRNSSNQADTEDSSMHRRDNGVSEIADMLPICCSINPQPSSQTKKDVISSRNSASKYSTVIPTHLTFSSMSNIDPQATSDDGSPTLASNHWNRPGRFTNSGNSSYEQSVMIILENTKRLNNTSSKLEAPPKKRRSDVNHNRDNSQRRSRKKHNRRRTASNTRCIPLSVNANPVISTTMPLNSDEPEIHESIFSFGGSEVAFNFTGISNVSSTQNDSNDLIDYVLNGALM